MAADLSKGHTAGLERVQCEKDTLQGQLSSTATDARGSISMADDMFISHASWAWLACNTTGT